MIINAAKAIIDGELKEQVSVEIVNGVIKTISSPVNNPDKSVDTLIPGFVDIHCHGGGGAYFSNNPELVAQTHLKHGTTSVLASLVTEPLEVLAEQVKKILPQIGAGSIKGIHLEGPYLAHSHCGAHDPQLLRAPKIEELQKFIDLSKENIRMVTLAPELEGAIEATEFLVKHGVVVALGHTGADADTTNRAIDAGATLITHFSNGMPKPATGAGTIAEVGIKDKRLALEFILDGHHINNEDATNYLNSGKHRSIVITDAMSAAGAADGDYKIGELPVTVANGVARLKSNGSLAGSTLTMDRAVLHMFKELNFSLPESINAATKVPAEIIGLKNVGMISVGYRADLLSFDGFGFSNV